MRRRIAFVLAPLSALLLMAAPSADATSGHTFTVQLDAQPPVGQPWAFLRMFPGKLAVHRGDVVNFAWEGTDTPHTATVVPSSDPEAWRQANQGSGGAYQSPIPDSQVGGDDNQLIENPNEVFPSNPGCGAADAPCSFNGYDVVSSGIQFPNPQSFPTWDVQINAPVGTYSFLCLLHPGMEIKLHVVRSTDPVASPADVLSRAANQVKTATKVNGEAADAQAQSYATSPLSGGGTKYTLNAGGFSDNVTANEYLDNPLDVNVGDKIRFVGTGEIHTATFPSSAFNTTPAFFTECNVPGPDPAATSPFDCAVPTQFEIVDNLQAISPSPAPHKLANPASFQNSGLLVPGVSATFNATKPGTYTFICLVHGPEMTGSIVVS